MYYQKNVDYVELLWEDFIYQIGNRAYKKQEKMYYSRFTKAIIYHFIIQDKTLSWRNKIGMHTSKDDYLINTLRFISAKESTHIYGKLLLEILTSPEMKESKAYKTYLGYATCVVPPKIARKFKKASPSKKDCDLVPVDEEPVKKGKQVKRPAKKSTSTSAAYIVIKEALVETKTKRKEKVDVTRGKGIDLLSEVSLTEEAQMKEVRRKSLRDFHRTHPSGSGTVAEKPPSVEKITPTATSKGTDESNDENDSESEGNDEENESDDDKTQSDNEKGSDSEQDTNGNESGSKSDHQEKEEEVKDDDKEEDEFVHTPPHTDDKDGANLESKSDDKIEGDKDKGMDDTTIQFNADVNISLNEPIHADEEVVQKEGVDAEMTDAQKEKENLEIPYDQVIEDAHLMTTNVLKETEVPATSSSRSSDLASKFLNFSDIHPSDAEIVSPLDVPIHHEVPNTQTTTLLPIPIFVITNIPQSSQTFTPLPLLSTPTPLPTTKTTNPPSTLPDFTSVFQFNNRIISLEKEVTELKKDPLYTQVTALVDDRLDARMGETREEFMNFLSVSLTARIIEQILIDKIDKSESYLAAPEHQDCYDSLIKSYNFDKDFFSSYDVYSLKRSRKDKDKDEDLFAGPDRGLKKRKTSKDAEPTTSPKNKDSTSGSSKGTKSQPKSSGKSVQLEEPEFEVADSDMPQVQEGNMGNDDDKPRKEAASRRDWFIKPIQPQEPADPNWNVGKTPQQGPTQNWLMTLAASTDKSLKYFDELMSTPINFSAYILNGLKIENLTQETLLGPAFRLLKGTHTNFAELEYDFEECYKAILEKLDWENPEGCDYPFDLFKPLPLVMSENRQRVPIDYFINNDLKYLQGGVLTMTYTTSTTKTKDVQYDLPGIEDMVPNIWSPIKVAYDKHALWGISHWREQHKTFYGYARGLESRHDVYFTKCILAATHVNVMRKHGYGYLEEIVVRRSDNDLYKFKEGDFPRLRINDIEDMLLLVVQNQLTNLSGDDVADFAIALRMFTRSLVIHNDGTLTRLLTSLEDITKNIDMEYLPKRRWSTLEKKRAHFMIKDINKLLKERRMMRSLEKFIGGRHYRTDLRLL
ncbi:hypothetical protein Tco_1440545 [Tanacetum coccineum]